jgi:predicted ATPase
VTRPAGTVTFLFTDIEESTARWESDPAEMRAALAAHDDVLRAVIEAEGGWLFKHTGDGVCAAFASPRAAVAAAIAGQRSLELPVRMGIATGESEQRGDDYFGRPLNHAARVMAAGHGGQILVAGATATLVEGFEFVDLGEHLLRGLAQPLPLLQVRADGLDIEFPPLKTIDVGTGNLPVQVTSLIGRDEHTASVIESLRANRLVTLVGVGGVGKTRLALQAAGELQSEHRDGAWLIELAPILDGADVDESVASVFTVAPVPGRTWTDGIIDALGPRKLLLVLDNCEHVLDAAAVLVEVVLARCPDVTILATSREPLGVGGEAVWPVPSLDVGSNSAAAKLFLDRARAVEPGFDPGNDLDAVAEICSRLDGIPLAIELAAARVRSMSPGQVRDRLDERFRLLIGSRRSLERHQTLQHAVQWSYDLLDANEQRVLQRVSVFAGVFSLAAAAEVCSIDGVVDELEMLDLLDSLVRKSLTVADRGAAEPRYVMLETIRQFAEQRLSETTDGDVVRARHASYFADRAEVAYDLWCSPDERDAYQLVEDEMANFRLAFRWAVDSGDVDAAIRIAACTHAPARMRLRTETFGWPVEVVGLARDSAHPKLLLLLSVASDSRWALGVLDEAKQYAQEGVALADDPRFEPFVWCFIDLAEIAMFEGDARACMEILRAGAAHPTDEAHRVVLAGLLWFGGHAGEHLPEREIAEAVATVQKAGMPLAYGISLAGQAAATAQHDHASAIDQYEEAIAVFESCGSLLFEQRARAELAGLLATSDDPERALASFVDIADAWRINGDTMLAAGIAQLAVLVARLGYHDAAARLFGAVTRTISLGALVPDLDAAMTGTRRSMGDAAFESACTEGAALTFDAAGDLALDTIARARNDLGST